MTLENSIKEYLKGLYPETLVYEVKASAVKSGMSITVKLQEKDGITLDKLAQINKKIRAFIEIEHIESGKFNLEVSSPGLFMELKEKDHYDFSRGKQVKLFLKDGGEVKGTLEKVSDSEIKVSGQKIKFCDIQKAKLDPDISFKR